MRLTTQVEGGHHVTIPRHDPLKIGNSSPSLMALRSITTLLGID